MLAAKRLLQKAMPQHDVHNGNMMSTDLDLRMTLHYGIPSTASILAFDPIQQLLAVGALDGRIKVIGGDNIEVLLISPKQLPYKNLEFLHNQGYLVSISNENDIRVWDLEHRSVACYLQWEFNITAFSAIHGTCFMYVGDEYGLMSVLKYDVEDGKLLRLPYHIPPNDVTEAAGISLLNHQSIVGILPQPSNSENRVLIAYENGLIILWDVSEGRVVLVRGNTDLQPKDEGVVDTPSGVNSEHVGDASNNEQEEKEICSLCWASTSGSILAVGYIDGDILLWNISHTSSTKAQQVGMSSNSVVKLQLSSGNRRLPVIVLHWSPNGRSHNNRGGQLFIYGGDEIGSEEVLTILSLQWSSGIETLSCIARVDLTLDGSFADMILIPNAGAMKNNPTAALFVLTNPGQLQVYDGGSLSTLTSQPDEKPSVHAEQFPVVIPTAEPYMTVAKLSLLPVGGKSAKALLEIASAMKTGAAPTLSAGTKWPLTGGVPSQLSLAEFNGVERIYIAGYQDGSIRMWDATYPVLSIMFALEGKVHGLNVVGETASVSALDFCPITTILAIGNEYGLVRIYKLCDNVKEMNIHFVSDTKHEVHSVRHGKGFHCIAVFSILNSPIQTLMYANSGAKLAVGFECGEVAVLDLSSASVLFRTDCASSLRSPIISIIVKAFTHVRNLINSPKHPDSKIPKDPAEGVLFILTRDAHIVVMDSVTGNMINLQPLHPKKESIAISMYVIEISTSISEENNECPQQLSQDKAAQHEAVQTNSPNETKLQEVELLCSSETTNATEKLSDSLLLLCCEDALRLYPLTSVIKGDSTFIRKVNLASPCCWSTVFKKKDEKASGLILLYQTGALEVRSLPDLEVVGESSLMSILRWNFKTNMAKTMCASDNGQIALVNGCELAFISLLACENDLRIPDSLPSLHDKVLAAAAEAAIGVSSNQKKKQSAAPGILGGIIKGIKGEKVGHTMGFTESLRSSSFTQQLDSIFSKDPFSEPSRTTADYPEVEDIDIDDIEIDEPLPIASTSSHERKHNKRDEETERQRLFDGANVDMKPRLRTADEIIAKYRKAGDVSAVASQARDKLAQRQEKLERISQRTAELESGAENFASMANELVKVMERRKWWQI